MSEYNFIQKHLSDYGGFYRGQGGSFDVFAKRSPIIRIYRFPKFVAGRGPIQSAAITSHRPETAMGKKGGFEW